MTYEDRKFVFYKNGNIKVSHKNIVKKFTMLDNVVIGVGKTLNLAQYAHIAHLLSSFGISSFTKVEHIQKKHSVKVITKIRMTVKEVQNAIDMQMYISKK